MQDTYDAFMNLWWLQPGTALTLHCMAADVATIPFSSPSIDIGCGDGTFLFTALGGRFDLLTRDIEQRPREKVDFGTDILAPSLDQARKLDFYNNIITHDNNDTFPFGTNTFKTIYCNTLYWVNDPVKTLREIRRILRPDGICLLHLMTPEIERPYEALKAYFDPSELEGMNRFKNTVPYVPNYYSQWRRDVLEAGLTITAERSVIPNFAVNAFLNTDFKIVLPELSLAMRKLDDETLRHVKRGWTAKLGKFVRTLLDVAPAYRIEEAPYLAFTVRKDQGGL